MAQMTPYQQPAATPAATDPLSQLLSYLKPQAAPITPGAGQPPAIAMDGTTPQAGAQPGGKTPGSLSNLSGDLSELGNIGSSAATAGGNMLSSIIGFLFP